MANLYLTDLTDAAWALVAPLLPPAGTGGRPRTTDVRAVLNAIFYVETLKEQGRRRISWIGYFAIDTLWPYG